MNTKPYWRFSAAIPQFKSLSHDVKVDVAIIGGGLTGITSAYLLKREGAKVALLERGRCAGTDTGHTTAHLTYVTDERLHRLVKTFGRDGAKAFWEAGIAGIDQISDIVRTNKIDCDFKWVPGFLHARLNGTDKKDRKLLEKDAQLAHELGFDAEFIEKVPGVNRPGVRFEHQAKFHPLKYLGPLLQSIPGQGSYVFEKTEASEIEADAPLDSLSPSLPRPSQTNAGEGERGRGEGSQRSDRSITVHAGKYKVRCSYLFIATHTPLMGKTSLFKATLFQTKLALYTSYVLGAKLPRGTVPEALFWDTTDPYYYLRIDPQRNHDYAIFGGEDCKTGQEDDPNLVFRRLEKQLKKILPNAEVWHRWLGQVVETNDGLPFIGENAGQQFVATGFCGNGFTLGTLSAVMVRDRYLGRKNPWFDLFAVNRKKFHGGTWRYIAENLDYPYYMLRDRLAGAEGDSLDDLKSGEGKILKLDGKKTAAYRNQNGKVSLCSPVCTHLKCIVHWNPADKMWDCPCHGSRFKPTGEVFSGPAEEPLEKLPGTDQT